VIELLGAVAILLFGVRFLSKGLDRLFGRQLGNWLATMTATPLQGFGAGVATTALAPSSTAISVLLVQMVHRGRIEAHRLVAVMLGANVGFTVVVQLLAFRLHEHALLLVAAGFFAFQFLQRRVLRGIGQTLLGFGLIFLAMGLIATAVSTGADQAQDLLVALQGRPWLLLVATAVLTVLFQSSTGAIGLALAVVQAEPDLLVPEVLISCVLGANIGIGVTLLIAGWRDLPARRLAVANLLPKLLTAFVVMLLLQQVVRGFEFLPGATDRQTAHFHSVFNLTAGLVFLPLTGLLWWLASLMVVSKRQELLRTPDSYLTESLFASPSMALANAHRETLVLADEVRDMLQRAWSVMERDDPALAKDLREQDDRIDSRYLALKRFLSRINEEDLSSGNSRWCIALLAFGNELESIGDVLDKELLDLVAEHAEERCLLDADEMQGLKRLYLLSDERFEHAISALAARDEELLLQLLDSKSESKEHCAALQREHYQRLRGGSDQLLSASAYFLDVVASLEHLNRHLSALAYAFGPSLRKG